MASDDSARAARLIRVAEAVVGELHRQGFSQVLADHRFDSFEIAMAVIKAEDGEVFPVRWSN
jgi:hypothetical protein